MNAKKSPAVPTTLPRLDGARIALRAMSERDAADLLAIYGDPLVMRYTDEAPFPDLETVGLMLASVRRLLGCGESLEWAVVPHGAGGVVGTCGLHSFDWGARTAEIGCLLRRCAWGEGYMAEAIGLLMAYARDVLGLTHLTADVAPENGNAQRLFRKLGFVQSAPHIWRIDLDARITAGTAG